uniref:Uncharacterized protein n=1 Tax=Panagrolaimus sp. ES5 TaxID=591445 RepID=A0AC34FNX7_9BILA
SERFLPHNQSGTRNNVQNVDQYRPLHYNPVRINRNLDQGRDDHDQYVRFLDDYRPLHDHEVRRESNLDQGRHDPHQFHPLPGDEYVRADLDYD